MTSTFYVQSVLFHHGYWDTQVLEFWLEKIHNLSFDLKYLDKHVD